MVLKSELRSALEEAFDTLPEDEEIGHSELIDHILDSVTDALDVYDDEEEEREEVEDEGGAVLFDSGDDE